MDDAQQQSHMECSILANYPAGLCQGVIDSGGVS